MAPKSWAEFWRVEEKGFFKIMRMSTSVFASRFIKHFQVDRNHKVLDFGCGPGFLIESLVKKEIQTVGLEINEFFVDECKRKFPGLSVHKIESDKEGLSRVLRESINEQKFDFIVLLSVSQYFDSKESCKDIVKSLKTVLKTDGKIIVADVVTPETSSAKDLFAVFTKSVISGNILDLFGFLRYLFFSDYRKLSKQNNLQSYSEDDFREITQASGLSYSLMRNLTLHPTRLNYILQSV